MKSVNIAGTDQKDTGLAVGVNAIVMFSPALYFQSDRYPASWNGKIPKLVKIAKTVHPDFPFTLTKMGEASKDFKYPAWVNSHGVVAAILPSGRKLRLMAYEFEIVEFH